MKKLQLGLFVQALSLWTGGEKYADEVITGGTGYKDCGCLPSEVEACFPDYTMYPNWEPAVGFLTRGCVRRCEWCLVPRKEGLIRPAATWTDIKRSDSRRIIFLDNNVLASDHGLEQIDRMGGEPTDEQQRFARWVNQKVLFKSCAWEDFQKERQGAAPILKNGKMKKGAGLLC